MPKKICNYPSCNELIKYEDTYCTTHGTTQTNYDKNTRDKDKAKFYNSKAWRTKRKEIMFKYGGLCQDCMSEDIVKSADVVDHIIEYEDDKSLALEDDNLVPLCHAHHNAKTLQAKKNRNNKPRTTEQTTLFDEDYIYI